MHRPCPLDALKRKITLKLVLNENLPFRIVWNAGIILALATLAALSINYLRHDRLPLLPLNPGMGGSSAADAEKEIFVSLAEAKDLFFSQAAVFIDARPDDMYRLGHIRGAVSLPWDDFENRFGAISASIPLDSKIITYCDGEGCDLSHELALALLGQGYKDVMILSNGWSLWQQENLPID